VLAPVKRGPLDFGMSSRRGGGRRRNWILPAQARVFCEGRWGRRRGRVEHCAAVLRARMSTGSFSVSARSLGLGQSSPCIGRSPRSAARTRGASPGKSARTPCGAADASFFGVYAASAARRGSTSRSRGRNLAAGGAGGSTTSASRGGAKRAALSVRCSVPWPTSRRTSGATNASVPRGLAGRRGGLS